MSRIITTRRLSTIGITFQIMNFVRLCELLVKSCRPSLSRIALLTTADPAASAARDQQAKLAELKADLSGRFGVELTVDYSDTLHDREIRLDSGWRVKIGRGLDLYRPPKGKAALGAFDMDLRPCHETTVDIFHGSSIVRGGGSS